MAATMTTSADKANLANTLKSRLASENYYHFLRTGHPSLFSESFSSGRVSVEAKLNRIIVAALNKIQAEAVR